MKYYVIPGNDAVFYGDVHETFNKDDKKYELTHKLIKYYTPKADGTYEEHSEKNSNNEFLCSRSCSAGTLDKFPTLDLAIAAVKAYNKAHKDDLSK